MLFGSRARKDNHDRSDVDIAVEPRGKFDNRKINVLKNKMEELNIPYKVEIVNLNEVSESFRKEILKDAVIWKD